MMAIPHTVILGTGIIGVSTAYYLSQSQPPSSIHLVEPSKTLFASSSGHAGGFLAKDWFGKETSSLGELSFNEHKKLAEKHNGAQRWGYAESIATSYVPKNAIKGERSDDWLRAGTSRAEASSGAMNDMDLDSEGARMAWLARHDGDKVEVISEPGTTAQLDPHALCKFLLGECLERGVKFHQPAEAVSVGWDLRGELASVRIVDHDSSHEVDIPCTRIIITAGLWTPKVFATLFSQSKVELDVRCIAGHSIIVRTPKWSGTGELKTKSALHHSKGTEDKACHALFTSPTSAGGFAPEVFSRRNGDIFIGGLNTKWEDRMSLDPPSPVAPSQPLPDHIEKLRVVAEQLVGTEDLEIVKEGLCYRPITDSGIPIVARIKDKDLLGGGEFKTLKGGEGGVFIATGHGPWGISMSLGTGKVMSELVRDVPLSADIKALGVNKAMKAKL